MEIVPEQTRAQYEVLYGDKKKWSQTTKAVYEHLFNGQRRIVAASDCGISEQTMYYFIKNNRLKHVKQAEILDKAEKYRDAGSGVVTDDSE